MTSRSKSKPKSPQISETLHAPILYFDEAPNFGYANGIVNFTLATYRQLPAEDGTVTVDLVVIGHMRCSLPAAKALRNALNQALALATPPPEKVN